MHKEEQISFSDHTLPTSDQQPTLNTPAPPGGPGGGGKQLHTTAAVVLNEDTTTAPAAVKSTAASTGVELSPAQAAEAMLTATTTITPAVNGSSGGAADAAGEVKISNL